MFFTRREKKSKKKSNKTSGEKLLAENDIIINDQGN